MTDDGPPVDLVAQAKWDRENGHLLYHSHGDPGWKMQPRMGGAWKPASFIRRGPLTDKQIDKYERQGFYSAEYRKARKEQMQKKRSGNFDVQKDGRMVYRP